MVKKALKNIQALFPQANTSIIKDASHFLQEDKPQEIAEIITTFLETVIVPSQESFELGLV